MFEYNNNDDEGRVKELLGFRGPSYTMFPSWKEYFQRVRTLTAEIAVAYSLSERREIANILSLARNPKDAYASIAKIPENWWWIEEFTARVRELYSEILTHQVSFQKDRKRDSRVVDYGDGTRLTLSTAPSGKWSISGTRSTNKQLVGRIARIT